MSCTRVGIALRTLYHGVHGVHYVILAYLANCTLHLAHPSLALHVLGTVVEHVLRNHEDLGPQGHLTLHINHVSNGTFLELENAKHSFAIFYVKK